METLCIFYRFCVDILLREKESWLFWWNFVSMDRITSQFSSLTSVPAMWEASSTLSKNAISKKSFEAESKAPEDKLRRAITKNRGLKTNFRRDAKRVQRYTK